MMPWERPELIKDPMTGLYPGQRDPLDIPDFLKRTHGDAQKRKVIPWDAAQS